MWSSIDYRFLVSMVNRTASQIDQTRQWVQVEGQRSNRFLTMKTLTGTYQVPKLSGIMPMVLLKPNHSEMTLLPICLLRTTNLMLHYHQSRNTKGKFNPLSKCFHKMMLSRRSCLKVMSMMIQEIIRKLLHQQSSKKTKKWLRLPAITHRPLLLKWLTIKQARQHLRINKVFEL